MATKKILLVAFLTLAIAITVGVAYAQEPEPEPTKPTLYENLPQIMSFTLIFGGVLARAFLPYLRKWLADEVVTFQKRYIAIIIASFVTAWVSFPQFPIAFIEWWQLITASFVFGFGLQSTYTEIYAWFATPTEKPISTPTP